MAVEAKNEGTRGKTLERWQPEERPAPDRHDYVKNRLRHCKAAIGRSAPQVKTPEGK